MFEPACMFLGVDGISAVPKNIYLIFQFNFRVFPKGIAGFQVGYFVGP